MPLLLVCAAEKSLQPETEKDEKVNSVILPLVTKQEKLELVGLTIVREN